MPAPAPDLELLECTATPVNTAYPNPKCAPPYGLQPKHVGHAMPGFVDFLTFINTQLHTKEIERFESMLMPANFSSMVGEFMTSNIPKFCPTIVKSKYRNGHPDMLPVGALDPGPPSVPARTT